MNKKQKIIVSICALVIIFTLWMQMADGIWFGGRLLNNAPMQKASQDLEFPSWKTYHNEKYGFQIKLPEGWTASVRDNALNHGYTFAKVFDTVELSKKVSGEPLAKVNINIGCFDGSDKATFLGTVEMQKYSKDTLTKPIVVDRQTSTYFYSSNHNMYDTLRFHTRIIKQVSPNQSYYDDCGFIIHSLDEIEESEIVNMVSSITFDKGFDIFIEGLNDIFKTIRPIPSQG